MIPYVVTHKDLTIDLSQVRGFQHLFKELKRDEFVAYINNRIVVELQSRCAYIKHPETGKFIEKVFNDTIEYKIPDDDYDTAQTIIEEWKAIWQEYLDDTAE